MALGRRAAAALALVVALFVPAVQALATPISGPIVNPANGHTYYLLDTSTWTAAEAEAVSLGGHLASVNDAAEDAWIFATFASFGGVDRHLYIGLNDMSVEGMFEWTSGEAVSYLNWDPAEPNNLGGTEDVVHIFGPQDARASSWNDGNDNGIGPGGAPVFGVAEIVPEPSTLFLLSVGLAGLSFRSRCSARSQPDSRLDHARRPTRRCS